MKCPKCSSEMESVRFQDIDIDRCTRCAGLWFDMLEAEQLKFIAGSDAVDSGSPDTGREQNKIGNINCPKCSVPMVRMVVMGQPHIWYEGCPVCYGRYFDAGEFKDFKTETILDTIKDFFTRERR